MKGPAVPFWLFFHFGVESGRYVDLLIGTIELAGLEEGTMSVPEPSVYTRCRQFPNPPPPQKKTLFSQTEIFTLHSTS